MPNKETSSLRNVPLPTGDGQTVQCNKVSSTFTVDINYYNLVVKLYQDLGLYPINQISMLKSGNLSILSYILSKTKLLAKALIP